MLSLRIQSVSVRHRGSLCVSEITEWIIIGSSALRRVSSSKFYLFKMLQSYSGLKHQDVNRRYLLSLLGKNTDNSLQVSDKNHSEGWDGSFTYKQSSAGNALYYSSNWKYFSFSKNLQENFNDSWKYQHWNNRKIASIALWVLIMQTALNKYCPLAFIWLL